MNGIQGARATIDWKKPLKQFFLVDLLTGLRRTLAHQRGKHIYTEQ